MSKKLLKNVLGGYMKRYEISEIIIKDAPEHIVFWGDPQKFLSDTGIMMDEVTKLLKSEVVSRLVFNESKIIFEVRKAVEL